MKTALLLTSFAPWRKHQRSNASDDVLVALQQQQLPASVALLRQLPVNLPIAKEITIAKLQQLQPQILVLCGMAESRSRISLEQQATVRNRTYQTSIDLNFLVKDLSITEISQDAGRYVCNSLYYSMLDYTVLDYTVLDYTVNDLHQASACDCVFVHFPVVTKQNRSQILADMSVILDRLLVQAQGARLSQLPARLNTKTCVSRRR